MAPSAIALCRDELAGHVAPAARAAGRSDPVSAETLVAVARRVVAAAPATFVSFNTAVRPTPGAVNTVDRMTEHGRTSSILYYTIRKHGAVARGPGLGGRSLSGANVYQRGINVGGDVAKDHR